MATLEQKAEQDNENSAEADLVVPTRNFPSTEIEEASGIQEQIIDQINLNAQLGLAIADADSGDVEVRSSQDPSFGDGINAESSAFAKAELDQDSDQDNENSASVEMPASFPDRGPETVQFAFAEQIEEVLQANLSLQAAAAIATADAGEVQATKEGELDAGETGIDASSSAAAIADLEQNAEQKNEDC